MRRSSVVASWTLVCMAFALVICGVSYNPVFAEGKGNAPGVPKVMSYEGYITDENGEPLPDGLYDFTFAIYADREGGSPLWVEEHSSVKVHKGIVRVRLGEGSVPRSLDLPFDRQYYLGIKIGDDPEMAPRLQFLTSAYSFRAKVADDVPDASITTEKLAPGSVTDEKIESVSWNKITGGPRSDAAAAQGPETKPKPSNQWHTDGNVRTDPDLDYIGTGDYVGLTFKTNADSAMWITKDGPVFVDKELTVTDCVTSAPEPSEDKGPCFNLGDDGQSGLRRDPDGNDIYLYTNRFGGNGAVNVEAGKDGKIEMDSYIFSTVSKRVGAFMLADSLHGLKRLGDDNVRLFTTGGHLLLEGGNVGIGTTMPETKLHVGPTTGGPADQVSSYPVYVHGSNNGIAVKVDGEADSDKNFVSFFADSKDGSNKMVGRIEGLDEGDLATDPEWIFQTALDLFDLAMVTIDALAYATSANCCAGLGAVCCPPVPSLVIAAGLKVVAQLVRYEAFQIFSWSRLGVAYQSGAGDYAEWLEKLDQNESIAAGDIVGVFGGKVTKSTDGAQQFMVVSKTPIVLGNMPPEDKEHLYEKVAFLGQVAVKVSGPVREGDYIIPSGLGDGSGIAVPPEVMTADEYARAVGRSWQTFEGQPVKYVTVAVGVNQGDIAAYVARQQAELQALMGQLASSHEAALKTREGLEELRSRVAELSGLYQEMVELKAAVSALQGLADAGKQSSQVVPASLDAAP